MKHLHPAKQTCAAKNMSKGIVDRGGFEVKRFRSSEVFWGSEVLRFRCSEVFLGSDVLRFRSSDVLKMFLISSFTPPLDHWK